MKKQSAITLVLAVLTVAFLAGCGNKADKKMDTQMSKYQEAANEFKNGLSGENIILAEIIDSTAQKIYYYDTNQGDLKVYDIASRSVWPNQYGAKDLKSFRLYRNRLCIYCVKPGAIRYGVSISETHYLFYINVSDGSYNRIQPDNMTNQLCDVSFLDDIISATFEEKDFTHERWAVQVSPYLSTEEYQSIWQRQSEKADSIREKYKADNQPNEDDYISSSQTQSGNAQQRLEQAYAEYQKLMDEADRVNRKISSSSNITHPVTGKRMNDASSSNNLQELYEKLYDLYNEAYRVLSFQCIPLAKEVGNNAVIDGLNDKRNRLYSTIEATRKIVYKKYEGNNL